MRNSTLLLAVFVGFASEQASKTSPEARQEILNYQLTLPRANQLITAMEAMTRYVVSLPDFQDRVRKSMTMTPAEQLAQVEKDPKAMAILKQNGLMAAQGMPAGPNIMASPANVAFAKAHLAELKPKMDAAEGIPSRK